MIGIYIYIILYHTVYMLYIQNLFILKNVVNSVVNNGVMFVLYC